MLPPRPTTFDTDQLVFDAIQAGAHAYLLKDASEADILETIKAVNRGESRISPAVARKVFEEFRRGRGKPAPSHDEEPQLPEDLNAKESRILELIADGYSNREIAAQVFLAEGTIKNYVSRIMEKFHARSRTDLAVKALRRPHRPTNGNRYLRHSRS